MLMQIEAVELAFFRDTQGAGEVDEIHEQHGNGKGRKGGDGAADELSLQQGEAAVIEEAVESGGVVGGGGTSGAVLAAGESSAPQRAASGRWTARHATAERPVSRLDAD